MGEFMGGAIHPVMTPAHALRVLGLGLSLGQHVPLRLRLPMGVYALCAAVALALTAAFTFSVPPPVLSGLALCAGAVVAAGRPLPALARGALFAAGAVAMGLDSDMETGGTAAVIRALLGTLAGLVILPFSIACYASLAAEQEKKWLHIALRVLGSWIVAISLLMLAFALRK